MSPVSVCFALARELSLSQQFSHGPTHWSVLTPSALCPFVNIREKCYCIPFNLSSSGASYGKSEMSALVSFGTSATKGWWRHRHRPVLNLDTATMLISFILFCKWLKSKTKRSTGDAIASLLTHSSSDCSARRRGSGVGLNVKLMQNCSWKITL